MCITRYTEISMYGLLCVVIRHIEISMYLALCLLKVHGNVHVPCQMFRKMTKLTEITSVTDKFAKRFQNGQN